MRPVVGRILTTRFSTALAVAAELHAGQKRKKVDRVIPYVAHLLAAASLVLEDGGDEDQGIAALLHDSIEDQGMTAERLEEQFGAEVARIVVACTDAAPAPGQQKEAWLPRKIRHLAKLEAIAGEAPDVSVPVLRVTAADKLHNCQDIVGDLERAEPTTAARRAALAHFNGGVEGTCWYYARMAALLGSGFPDSPLTARLDTAARRVHELAGIGFPAPQPPA